MVRDDVLIEREKAKEIFNIEELQQIEFEEDLLSNSLRSSGNNYNGRICRPITINYLNINYLNGANSITKNGVTLTVNDDGSLTLDGTSSSFTQFELYRNTTNLLPNGETYTFYSGQQSYNIFVYVHEFYNNTWNQKLDLNKIGTYTPTSEATVQLFSLAFLGGTTFSNVKIYPMLLKGEYTIQTIPSFEPYDGCLYGLELYNSIEANFITDNYYLNCGIMIIFFALIIIIVNAPFLFIRKVKGNL